MKKDLEVLKELRDEIERSLEDEHLKNNKVEAMQAAVNRIIEKKKKQIQVLDKILKENDV